MTPKPRIITTNELAKAIADQHSKKTLLMQRCRNRWENCRLYWDRPGFGELVDVIGAAMTPSEILIAEYSGFRFPEDLYKANIVVFEDLWLATHWQDMHDTWCELTLMDQVRAVISRQPWSTCA